MSQDYNDRQRRRGSASANDFGSEIDDEDEEDYYMFLNVSRDATSEDIAAAYRHLSRLYHPDKHAADDDNRRAAEKLFARVKDAYEVLHDAGRRAIYDQLGARAARAGNWQIVARDRTPAEIYEEYARLAREAERRRLQRISNARGSITLSVDATDLLAPYDVDYLDGDSDDDGTIILSLPNISVSGLTFTQSVDTPLTASDTLVLSGQVAAQNGTGHGQVSATWRRLCGCAGWLETEVGVGSGLLLSGRVMRQLSRRTHMTAGLYLFLISDSAGRCGATASISCRLSSCVSGQLTCRLGAPSSVQTQLVRETECSRVRCVLQLGLPHSHVAAHVLLKMPSRDYTARVTVKLATTGVHTEWAIDHRLSSLLSSSSSSDDHHSQQEEVAAEAGVSLAVTAAVGGVAVRLRITRAGQHYQLLVRLADELLPSAVLYGSCVPLLTALAFKSLILQPYWRRRERQACERRRTAVSDRVKRQRAEAQAAVALMTETVSRVRRHETECDGLLLLHAYYGAASVLQLGDSEDVTSRLASRDDVIDVTVALQCLVKQSRLQVPPGGRCHLPGFYDPCPQDKDKHLLIIYQYRSVIHRCVLADSECVNLPLSSHRVVP